MRLLLLVAGLFSATSFAAPVLESLDPSSGPTTGGTRLTLRGTDFGAAPTVLIDSRVCGNQIVASAFELSCDLPAGTGASVPVVVTSAGELSNAFSFSYFAPAITQLAPAGAPSSGSTRLTLTGSNFGAAGAAVTVGGSPCPLQSASHLEVVCTLPPGGGSVPVRVTVRDQSVTSSYSYGTPAITSLAPSTGPTSGGTRLTLTGSNFGDTRAQVRVNGSPCDVVTPGHSQLVCTLPPGEGAAATVEVLVGGLSAASTDLSYVPPSLSMINPSSGPTLGGIPITLIGDNFGLSPRVALGGTDCPVTEASHFRVVCTAPGGQGTGSPVVVTAGMQSSAPLPFDYLPPRLDGLSPASAPRAGGTPITLHGSNFGSSGSVTVGGQSCPISAGGHEQNLITCVAPPGSGSAEVRVSVSGQTSNAATLKYAAPIITSLSPTEGPTSGGVRLTISGANFGASGASLSIGGQPCEVEDQTDGLLHCIAPGGTGASLPVEVSSAGESHLANQRFSYVGPAVTSLSPATGARSGGTLLTIQGSNFGSSDATVSVDGAPCPVSSAGHSEVVCATPAHASGGAAVQVTVSGQRSNAVTYHYVDAPPVAQAQAVETDEDTGLTITLAATDSDGDPLTYSIVSHPPAESGSVALTGDRLTFTPAPHFHGAAGFTFAAHDGELGSSPASVEFTVAPVNDAPVAIPASVEATAGASLELTLGASDLDGDPVTFALATSPPGNEATVTLSGGVVTVRPTAGFTGTTAFTFIASDGALVSSAATVSVTVGTAAGAPVASDTTATTEEDTAVTWTLPVTDPDESGPLHFAIVDPLPAGAGVLSLEGSALTFSPAHDFHGVASFTFLASDGLYTSNVATATITVTAVNDAPVAVNQSVATAVGAALDITLGGVDPDADALTFALTTSPEVGTVTLDGTVAHFAPPADFSGQVSFGFTVTDGQATSAGTVTVAVLGTTPGSRGCGAVPTGPAVLGALTVALLSLLRRRRGA